MTIHEARIHNAETIRAPDKRGTEDNSKIIFLISQ